MAGKGELDPEEYAALLGPERYYQAWRKLLRPAEFVLSTSYRSYQRILDYASTYLPEGSPALVSCPELARQEPKEYYVLEHNVRRGTDGLWRDRLCQLLHWAEKENESHDPKRSIRSVAAFFRTNQEVFEGFTQAQLFRRKNVHIRIQGNDVCALWRRREFFFFLSFLDAPGTRDKVLRSTLPLEAKELPKESDGLTSSMLLARITAMEKEAMNCGQDLFSLSVLRSLVLAFFDEITDCEANVTSADLADYIRDTAGKDDSGQIFKIHERYSHASEEISLIFTTMHKVKGLEFDAVLMVQSKAPLPLKADLAQDGPKLNAASEPIWKRRDGSVATSRAKKRLELCIGPREQTLRLGTVFVGTGIRSSLFYEKDPALDKYNLNASYNWKNHTVISRLPLHAPLRVIRIRHESAVHYNIFWDRYCVGQLSSNSSIVAAMEKRPQVNCVTGFFLSDLVAWTLDDVERFDQKKGTNYSQRWCAKAREAGFIPRAVKPRPKGAGRMSTSFLFSPE